MQRYSVVFTPEAAEQLDALYADVAAAASPATALSYTNAIVSYCEGLNISPQRGSRRDDVRPVMGAGAGFHADEAGWHLHPAWPF